MVGVPVFHDVDRSFTANAGDTLTLRFDRDVVVANGSAAAIELPVSGDSLGAAAQVLASADPRSVTVVLGDGARLKTRQRLATEGLGNNAASGVGIADGSGIQTSTGAVALPTGPFDLVPGFVLGAQVSSSGSSVVLADFDLDGRVDAVVGHAAGGFSYYRGQLAGDLLLTGSFGNQVVRNMAFGDVNRDGRPDLVLAIDGNDQVWLNTTAVSPGIGGGLAFSLGATLDDDDDTRDVILADLDRDCDLDILTAGADGLRVFAGDDTGSFSSLGLFFESDARALGLADFDRNGIADCVVASADGATTLLGQGDLSFAAGTQLSTLPLDGLSLADVDRNGFVDVVAASAQGSLLWLADAGGSFPATGSSLSLLASSSVLLVDVDADDRPDLIEAGGGSLRVLMNNRNGAFQDTGERFADIGELALASADLERDGDPELVAVGAATGVRVLNGSLAGTWGDFTFRDSNANAGLGPVQSLAVTDLDRDGGFELASGTNRALQLRRGFGPGDEPVELTFAGDRVQDIEFADFDLDGDIDLLVALASVTGSDGGLAGFLNDGEGGLVAIELAETLQGASGLTLGDLDCDGDIDAVLGNRQGAAVQVIENLGLGKGGWLGFAAPVVVAQSAGTSYVELGDLDRDGLLDLALGQGEGSPDRILFGVGDRSFVDSGQALGAEDTRDIGLADIDRDGDLDYFAVAENTVDVYRNDGEGNFSSETSLISRSARRAVVGDVDGDGDLDVVVGRRRDGSNAIDVRLNDGQGNFETLAERRLAEDFARSLLLFDLDRDGDLDLVSGSGRGGGPTRLWLNR